MQYQIMLLGAGGIGGFLAGKLCGKGAKVTLVARGASLAAIREKGLLLSENGAETLVKPDFLTDKPEEAGVQDAIFLCTKGYGLDQALGQIRPCVGPETLVIPLLNGVSAYKRIKAQLDTGVIADGCIYVFSRILSPGVVEKIGTLHHIHTGIPGRTAAEAPEKLHGVVALLNASGLVADVADDIEQEIWKKFLMICANGQANAYFDAPVGKLREESEMWAFLLGLIDEILEVAEAEGISLPADLKQKTIDSIRGMAYGSTSSLSRDLKEPGKPTELDLFAGEVVRLADKHGLSVPNNRAVLARFPGRA